MIVGARNQGIETENEKNVFMYNRQKEVWYQLKPLLENLKVCNAVDAGMGKFHLFMLDPARKQDLPKIIAYDLKEMCPKLDRYWAYMKT